MGGGSFRDRLISESQSELKRLLFIHEKEPAAVSAAETGTILSGGEMIFKAAAAVETTLPPASSHLSKDNNHIIRLHPPRPPARSAGIGGGLFQVPFGLLGSGRDPSRTTAQEPPSPHIRRVRRDKASDQVKEVRQSICLTRGLRRTRWRLPLFFLFILFAQTR